MSRSGWHTSFANPRSRRNRSVNLPNNYFEDIICSVDLHLAGRKVRVPNRNDYLTHLRKLKVLGPQEKLADRIDLAEQIYKHWQSQPQIACLFGRRIARDPKSFGILRHVVKGEVSSSNMHLVAKEISSVVDEKIGAKDVEGASILIPGLEEVDALVNFIRTMGQQPDWNVRAVPNPSDKWERIYVELKRAIGEDVFAEVLGFGPFPFLPLTRQSPLPALELRVKQKGARDKKSPSNRKYAHLADIPFKYKKKIFKRTWERSEKARLEILSGDDSAARARITFAIPSEHWNS